MLRAVALAAVCVVAPSCFGWDYVNHRLINQLALASLPTNFPAFVHEPQAAERIAFLGGEPDRWRNSPDLPLKHLNNPDHFFDFEFVTELGLDLKTLSVFRYDFSEQLFNAQKARPNVVPVVEASRDLDRTKRLIGFLPWTITEQYAKLKSSFSYLKAFEALGSEDEVRNAQANIIYTMGVLGHFPADGAQPLHTTKSYNGWVGDNPAGYTTNRSFHAWIDGGFLELHPLDRTKLTAKLRPAKTVWAAGTPEERADVFHETVAWLEIQFAKVQPLYELEKAGKLKPDTTEPVKAVEFLEGQVMTGAQFVGDLWFTAWRESQPDRFLMQFLKQRQEAKPK